MTFTIEIMRINVHKNKDPPTPHALWLRTHEKRPRAEPGDSQLPRTFSRTRLY